MSRLDRHNLVAGLCSDISATAATEGTDEADCNRRRWGHPPAREKVVTETKLADFFSSFFLGVVMRRSFAYCIASAAAVAADEVGKEGASQLRFPIYIHDRWQ